MAGLTPEEIINKSLGLGSFEAEPFPEVTADEPDIPGLEAFSPPSSTPEVTADEPDIPGLETFTPGVQSTAVKEPEIPEKFRNQELTEDGRKFADALVMSAIGQHVARFDGRDDLAKLEMYESLKKKLPGVTFGFVEDNFENLRDSLVESDFDPEEWRRRNPALFWTLLDQGGSGPTGFYRNAKVSAITRAIRWYREASNVREILSGRLPQRGEDGAVLETTGERLLEQSRLLKEAKSKSDKAWDELLSGSREMQYVRMAKMGTGAMVLDAVQLAHKQTEISMLGASLWSEDWQLRQLEESETATPAQIETARQKVYEVKRNIIKLREEIGLTKDYGQGEGGQILLEGAQFAASQYEFLKSQGGGALFGGGVGLLTSLALSRALPVSSPMIMEGMAIGARVGMLLMGAEKSFELEAGSLYLELSDMKDQNGAPISKDIIDVATMIGGGASASVEFLNVLVGPAAKVFGPLGEMVAKGKSKQWLKEALLKRSMRGFWKNLARDWAAVTAGEAAEETVQEGINFLTSWASKNLNAGASVWDWSENLDTDELYVRSLSAGAHTVLFGGLMPIGTAPVNAFQTKMMLNRSAKAVADIEMVAELAKSEEARSAPRWFADLVTKETDRTGAKVESVWVDPKALEELAKERGVSLEDMMPPLLGDDWKSRMEAASGVWSEALGERATLEVPLAEFLEKWGDSGIVDAMKRHLTTHEGNHTMAEKADGLDQEVQDIVSMLREMEDSGAIAIGENEREFSKKLKRQLVDTDHLSHEEATAAVYLQRAFNRAISKRLAVPVEDLFRQQTMTVTSATSTLSLFPKASRQLSEQISKMDTDAKARAMFIDTNAGVMKDNAFVLLPRDPDRQYVAYYSFEGVKFMNSYSHLKGNMLYRLAGKALTDQVADASRWRGDFVSTVRSDDEGRTIAENAKNYIRDSLKVSNPDLASEIDGIEVTFKVVPIGEDVSAAANTAADLDATEKKAREDAGTRAKRGSQPKGIPLSAEDLAMPPIMERVFDLHETLMEVAESATDKEVFDTAFLDVDTGLLSRLGFFSTEEMDYVASLDLNGLQDINNEFSIAHGDFMLREFARFAIMAGGDEVYMAHLSGDEYAIKSNNADLLQFYVDILGEMCETFVLENKDGKEPRRGITFGYGISNEGTNLSEKYDAADKKVDAFKIEFKKNPEGERVERGNRSENRWSKSLPKGGERLAFGGKAQGHIGDGKSTGVRSRKSGASAARREAVARTKLEAIRAGDTAEIAKALLDEESLEARVVNEIIAGRMFALKRPPKGSGGTFKNRNDAWERMVLASFPESGTSPTEQADSLYLKAKRGEGKMPGPFGDNSVFDGINTYLGLSEKGKAKSGRHAFDLLMGHFRSEGVQSMEERALKTAEVFRKNGKGFEGFVLPADTEELLVKEAQAAEFRQMQLDYYSDISEGEYDTSFDTDRIELNEPAFAKDAFGNVLGVTNEVSYGLHQTLKVFLTNRGEPGVFLHELAHVFHLMLGNLDGNGVLTGQAREDYMASLRELGAEKDENGRYVATAEIMERWARSFEEYFLEGKAPSASLAGSFYTYQKLVARLHESVPIRRSFLNDELRGIFNRLLATDREIKAMEDAAGLNVPLFKSHEEAGVPKTEWENYIKERIKLSRSVAIAVQRKMVEGQHRAAKAFKKDEFRRIRAEAKKDWDNRPDVRAKRYMAKGELELENGRLIQNDKIGRLDRELVEEAVGKDAGLRGGAKKRLRVGGENPSVVARQFGFASAEEMLKAVIDLPNEKKFVREEAEARMREKHPEIDGEIANLDETILRLLHENSKFSLLELRMLGRKRKKKKGRVHSVDDVELADMATRRAANAAAEQRKVNRLGDKRVLDGERTAAHYAAMEAAKDNFRKAREYKLLQVFRQHLWLALDAAKRQREQFKRLVRSMRKLKSREERGQSGRDFIDATDQIMEAFGLMRKENIADRMPLSQALRQIQDTFDVEFDLEGLFEIFKSGRKWNDFTVRDMRIVHEILAEINELSKGIGYIISGGKRMRISNLINSMENETESKPDKLGRSEGTLSNLDASLREPQVILRKLGPTMYKTIWGGYLDAEETFDKMFEEVGKDMTEAWEKLPVEIQTKMFEEIDDKDGVEFDPEVVYDPPTIDHRTMMMIALNMGNISNRARLLGGYGWSEAAVLAWLNRNMSEHEWEFVQSIWKLLDQKMFPRVAEVYERQKGLPPPKIEATPIETRYGTVTGGYFPARYDPKISAVGKKQAERQVDDTYHVDAGKISVANSFTKRRVENYTDVILLDWNIVPYHLLTVMHYIAFDEFVRDANRIMHDQRFEKIARMKVGGAMYDNLTNLRSGWISNVSSSMADAVPKNLRAIASILGWGRAAFVTKTIGWSVKTSLADYADPLSTMFAAKHARIGPLALLSNMAAAYSGIGWRNMRARALKNSREVRHRTDAFKRDTMVALNMTDANAVSTILGVKALGKNEATRKFQYHGSKILRVIHDSRWMFMELADRVTTTVIWNAAFDEAKAAGMNDSAATAKADDVVQASMPVMTMARKSSVMRDRRGLAPWIVFYGYFNKKYNQVAEVVDEVSESMLEEDSDYMKKIGLAAGGMVSVLAIGAVTQLIGELLTGRGKEEDEEDAEWMLRKTLAFPFMLYPFIGIFAEGVVNAAVSKAFQGEAKERSYNVRSAPLISTLDDAKRKALSAGDSGRDLDERIWDAIEFFSIPFMLPTGSAQFKRTRQYITEGSRRRPEGVIYSPREGKPEDPVSFGRRILR